MARLQTPLGMMLVLLMFMAGCIYNDTPEWGTGDGQVHVEYDEDSADVESKMGEGFEETFPIVGCGESQMKVTGMLISSEVYSEHPTLSDVQSAMGAAVIIHTMSWSSAEAVEEGKAGRISLKDWSEPLNPSEAVGSKLSDNENEWEVIGIIPASENVAGGLNILQHWHEPIEMKGYVLGGNGLAGVNPETCALEGQGHGMIVTSIKTSQGVVSLDGEHDDEYSLGDTDIFGGWTFILFFLLVGVGGGVGLFVVSTMVIRQGAKATAEALLGREGFAKSVQMKKDIKQSKKDGLLPPEQKTSPRKKSSPPPKKKKEEDVAIPGFSLDSVLQSDSSESGQKTFGGGNSVVVTSEAKEMESAQPVASSMPQVSSTPMPSAGVVSTQPEPAKREHFSSSMSRSATQPTAAANPTKGSRPVKRRSVKKRAAQRAEPEPQPERVAENKRASVADDEEFSDFSF